MRCNVVKVRCGTNAVRSKSKGRHNITAQQLLSLFFAFYCIWSIFSKRLLVMIFCLMIDIALLEVITFCDYMKN